MLEHVIICFIVLGLDIILLQNTLKDFISWSKHVVLDGWDFAQIGHDKKVNPYRIQAKTCLVAESQ